MRFFGGIAVRGRKNEWKGANNVCCSREVVTGPDAASGYRTGRAHNVPASDTATATAKLIDVCRKQQITRKSSLEKQPRETERDAHHK